MDEHEDLQTITAGRYTLVQRSQPGRVAGGWWLLSEVGAGVRMSEAQVEKMLADYHAANF